MATPAATAEPVSSQPAPMITPVVVATAAVEQPSLSEVSHTEPSGEPMHLETGCPILPGAGDTPTIVASLRAQLEERRQNMEQHFVDRIRPAFVACGDDESLCSQVASIARAVADELNYCGGDRDCINSGMVAADAELAVEISLDGCELDSSLCPEVIPDVEDVLDVVS